MRSRLLTNLFLLLLAIGLGTFLFVDEIEHNGVKQLTDISADAISQIFIYHHQREINLDKSDSEWRMTQPIEITANQFRVKTLLNLLSTTSHVQYNADDLDLKKYGLDQPESFIRFDNFKIDFGILNPINDLRYVKIGNQLHLIDEHYYPLLSSQIGTLIARELLSANSKINQLVLPEATLTRADNELWKSTTDISSDAIVETIYQWTHKQAFAVHDYVARESLGEIRVHLDGSGTPILFQITDVEPWLILARPDMNIEYHFNLEDYDALLRPGASKKIPDEFQDESSTETIQVSPDEFIDAIQSQ